MRHEDQTELRALQLFTGMSEDAFAIVMRGAYVQNFPPSIELISEGDPADFLHVVMAGGVEMLGGWNGRETTVMTIRPVCAFIVAATIKDQPYLMSARTLEKSRIALIPSEDVREAFSIDPAFAGAVVTELANGYRGAIKSLKNLKLRSGIERLANYLLQLRGDGPDTFELRLEKRRLASLLGMSPENLSRAFNSLRAYGVKVDGPMITLGDMRALMRLAKPQARIDDPSY